MLNARFANSPMKLAALPTAADPDAKRTLRPAVEELAYATALTAANSDPERPKVIWQFTAPRTWLGHDVPGSRWGIDNPDNVYRVIPVDGHSKYELRVKSPAAGPVQFSFFVYDSYVGEDGRQAHLDTPVAGLRDRDIKVGADGTFTITVDSTPADGRQNHIQTNDSARVLLVRNTLSDWDHQAPAEVSVLHVGAPAGKPLTDQETAHRAATLLAAATETEIGWLKSGLLGFSDGPNVNAIAKPIVRGGGWGFGANGNFKLADDEALVVTLDPLGARYLGFDLTNPWLVSLEHIRGSGSLNNVQAQRNSDGGITYVIAGKDPGIYNWLSTAGVHAGQIFIRWQAVPDAITSAEKAVRSVKVVKLQDLRAVLPADTRNVTAAERGNLIDKRAAAYAHRYVTAAAVANLAAPR